METQIFRFNFKLTNLPASKHTGKQGKATSYRASFEIQNQLEIK